MTTIDQYQRPPQTQIEAAAFVIAQFQALGLSAPARIVEMHRVLSRGKIEFDDLDFFTALESLRDLHQLVFIFEQLCSHRDDPRFRNDVKHLLNDSALPQDDADSPGRDRQLELYLAAICQNGGLVPVGHEEPDVTCWVNGTKFGIAAKRLKSNRPSQLEKHIRKGAEQLQGQNLPGIIAIDVTMSRNRRNRPVISQIENQLYLMIAEAKWRHFRNEHEANIRRGVAGTGVRAVLVLESMLRLLPERKWWHDGMLNWLPISPDEEHPDELFAAFYDGFSAGIPCQKETSVNG